MSLMVIIIGSVMSVTLVAVIVGSVLYRNKGKAAGGDLEQNNGDNEPLTDYELTLMASGELHANGATVLPNGLVEVRRSSMPLGALVKAKNNKRHLSARGRAAVDGRGAAVDEARAQSRSPTRPAPGAGPSRPSTGNTKLAMFGPGDAKRQKTRERILEKHMQKIAATVGGGQQ